MRTLVVIWIAVTGIALGQQNRLPRPRFAKDKLEPLKNPIMNVVLVHGFMEVGGNYRMLHKRLHKKGIGCLIVRLTPRDGSGGLEKLAQQLKEQINKAYGTEKRFSMVGFSMGGLVSRYYLQELGGAKRCDQLITLSTPHHGTRVAKLYPSKGARQMRPGSDFLKNLEKSEDKLGDMPIASYRTPYDLIVLPTSSSIWKRASNHSFPILLHPWMLDSDRVLKDVVGRLLDHR